jgi:hypothetical protein
VRIKLEGAPSFELPMIQSSTVGIKGDNVEMTLYVLAGNRSISIHAPISIHTAEALALQLGTMAFRAKTSQK